MARRIVDIDGLTRILPLTKNQIYRLIKQPVHPIPFKKCNKRLMFDVESVFRWFDSLPGKDNTYPKSGIDGQAKTLTKRAWR